MGGAFAQYFFLRIKWVYRPICYFNNLIVIYQLSRLRRFCFENIYGWIQWRICVLFNANRIYKVVKVLRLRNRNKAILMYRILNNQGASSLKESFTRISALEINYNLRNSSTDLVLPHPKREFLKNSFKFSGAKLWNSLPLQAKLAQSEYTFKMNINSLDT